MNDRTRLAIFFVPGVGFLLLGVAFCVIQDSDWMWESGVPMVFLGVILILWGFSTYRNLRHVKN